MRYKGGGVKNLGKSRYVLYGRSLTFHLLDQISNNIHRWKGIVKTYKMSQHLLENSNPFCQKSLKTTKKLTILYKSSRTSLKLCSLESLDLLLSSYTPYRGWPELRFRHYFPLNEKSLKNKIEKTKFSMNFVTFLILDLQVSLI